MNKINPTLFHNLSSSLIGRLRLRIFKIITGMDFMTPTREKTISYLKKNYKDNTLIIAIVRYILTNGRFAVIDFKELDINVNIEQLFKKLDENPLNEPMFYEVSGFHDNESIGVQIFCSALTDIKGYFYKVVLLSEQNFLEKIGVCEIRTSQEFPEPAFCYFDSNRKWVKSSREERSWRENSTLKIAIQVLNYMSKNHIEHFIGLEKSLQEGEKTKFRRHEYGPDDPQYMSLIKQLYIGEIACHVVYIKMDKIIPFSFKECFAIPFYEINDNSKRLADFEKHGVVVYWKDGNYILSDDYLAYMVLRTNGVDNIKTVILGNAGTENLKIQFSGDHKLLPPMMVGSDLRIDQLELPMRKFLLDEYVVKLAAMNNLKDIASSKCIVFSEDRDTKMLKILLMANGFDSEETIIMSYDNCTKIDLLPLTLQTLRKIKKDLLFLIHRDRDYLDNGAILKLEKKITALGAVLFITKGTDIESHYLNGKHINYLYPNIALEKIERAIMQATESTKYLSIEKMMKEQYGEKYKNHNSEKEKFAEQYCHSPERYRIGKDTMRIVKNILHADVDGNINVVEPSPYLRIDNLQSISTRVWSY